jgi:hypothetical protein
MAQIARLTAQQGAPRRCAGHGTFAVDRLVGALLGVESPAAAQVAGGARNGLAAVGLDTQRSRRGKPARVARQETSGCPVLGSPSPVAGLLTGRNGESHARSGGTAV